MNKYLVAATLSVATVFAGALQADVSVKYVSSSPNVSLTVVNPFNPSGESIPAGLVNIQVDLQNGDPAFTASAFCIDLKQFASTSWQSYELEVLEVAPRDSGSDYGPMGPSKANAIRELWGEHFTDVVDSTSAAAFQSALWEIIYENSNVATTTNSWDLNSGNLNIDNSSVASLANSWLADVGDNSQTLETSLLALTNDDGQTEWQDYVFRLPGGDKPPVPEPVTMASMLMAISGLGVYMRKRTVA